ncbi:MAG: hypothetical protein AAGD09_24115 [Cyanobacteria bacterium P01_F01_bin.56]
MFSLKETAKDSGFNLQRQALMKSTFSGISSDLGSDMVHFSGDTKNSCCLVKDLKSSKLQLSL